MSKKRDGSGARLRQALTSRRMSIRAFQKEMEGRGVIGASYPQIHRYLRDDPEPSLAFLREAANVLAVRLAWLAVQDGQMTTEDRERSLDAEDDIPVRRLLVVRTGGERLRLVFPAAWKVTFAGGLNPQQIGSYGGPGVLRLYSGNAQQQRCVLREVVEFFDMDELCIEQQKSEVRMLPPERGQRGPVENVPHHTYLDEWEPYPIGAVREAQPKARRGRQLLYGGGLAEAAVDALAQQVQAQQAGRLADLGRAPFWIADGQVRQEPIEAHNIDPAHEPG